MAIASADRVDRQTLMAFIRPRHRGVLTTRRRDGNPQVSPVAMGVDGEERVVVATYPERAKARNVERDGWACVCVLSDDWDGPWVQVEGTAEVLHLPAALDPLVEYFRSISGEHDDWDDYRAAMRRQGKCLVRVTVDRWGPVATGGFPPPVAED